MASCSGHSAHLAEGMEACNSGLWVTSWGISTWFVNIHILFFGLTPNSSTNCEIWIRKLKAREAKQQHKAATQISMKLLFWNCHPFSCSQFKKQIGKNPDIYSTTQSTKNTKIFWKTRQTCISSCVCTYVHTHIFHYRKHEMPECCEDC